MRSTACKPSLTDQEHSAYNSESIYNHTKAGANPKAANTSPQTISSLDAAPV